jgi:hypothetical protein
VLYVSYETGLVALPDTKPGDLSFTFSISKYVHTYFGLISNDIYIGVGYKCKLLRYIIGLIRAKKINAIKFI